MYPGIFMVSRGLRWVSVIAAMSAPEFSSIILRDVNLPLRPLAFTEMTCSVGHLGALV